MARYRTIKPEFWTSEQILLLSRDARLLFIGLWTFADDAGILPASYITLKAKIFPLDNCSLDEIKNWTKELLAQGLIKEYKVNDITYWVITGFKIHQKIDKPSYKYPNPPEILENSAEIKEPSEKNTEASAEIKERSALECSVVECKGKEEKVERVEGSVRETIAPAAPVAQARPLVEAEEPVPKNLKPDKRAEEIQEIFEHWRVATGHIQAKLDDKRKKLIRNALKMGYSVTQLKNAITGCSLTPHNQGHNDRGEKYMGLHIILRNAEQIDRFIGNYHKPPRILTTAEKNMQQNASTLSSWADRKRAEMQKQKETGQNSTISNEELHTP